MLLRKIIPPPLLILIFLHGSALVLPFVSFHSLTDSPPSPILPRLLLLNSHVLPYQHLNLCGISLLVLPLLPSVAP